MHRLKDFASRLPILNGRYIEKLDEDKEKPDEWMQTTGTSSDHWTVNMHEYTVKRVMFLFPCYRVNTYTIQGNRIKKSIYSHADTIQ